MNLSTLENLASLISEHYLFSVTKLGYNLFKLGSQCCSRSALGNVRLATEFFLLSFPIMYQGVGKGGWRVQRWREPQWLRRPNGVSPRSAPFTSFFFAQGKKNVPHNNNNWITYLTNFDGYTISSKLVLSGFWDHRTWLAPVNGIFFFYKHR